jgi:hypothetical protein
MPGGGGADINAADGECRIGVNQEALRGDLKNFPIRPD